ncbi:sulfatase-like hydrolase/transferase [Myxococcota bacterium]|nr:sulfatase-like hydrolase/transferase [Myxococcota bacterium]
MRWLLVLGLLHWFSPPPQNTLLILADDVGVDAIGAYQVGDSAPPTPVIDSLATEGVLFRNAWSTPLCSATRAGIHTGRYGFRTGVGAVVSGGRGMPLSTREITLPEVLDASGHAHALIGKWHLGDVRNGGDRGPNLAGWSHFAGHLWNIKPPESYFRWRKVVDGEVSTSERYATSDNVDDALRWIEKQSGPWVCVVSFNAAHSPFHAPPAALHTQDLEGADPSEEPRRFYDAMVEAMDSEIGRLLTSLPKDTLARTNVIFAGDNGTPSGLIEEPFGRHRGKTTLYQGGIHVPLIARGPAISDPGREVDALVGTVDLFPTVAELSGVDLVEVMPPDIVLDGVSLVPYFEDEDQKPLRETVYTERFGVRNAGRNGVAIRDERYKLIRWRQTEALFDLLEDPYERKNLLLGRLTPEQRAADQSLRKALALMRPGLPIPPRAAAKPGQGEAR